MKLPCGAHVVAAWAENATGPGWANTPVWVLIRLPGGYLDMHALQPDNQGRELLARVDEDEAKRAKSARKEAE